MSQLGNMGAPTPRRSGRLSTKASSVAGESVVTTVTVGGTRQRHAGALTKVQPRKSNAYGASGRFGNPETISYTATGFAQAFQHQRGDASNRDNDEEEVEVEAKGGEQEQEEESKSGDDIDELGAQPESFFMKQARHSGQLSPGTARKNVPRPRVTPSLSLDLNDEFTASEDDLATSIASKSFGPSHEAGMLSGPPFAVQGQANGTPSQRPAARRSVPTRAMNGARIPSQAPPQAQNAAQAPIRVEVKPAQPARRTIPANKSAIEQSVDDLIAEEAARLQREGPPQPQAQPRPQPERRRPHPRDPQEVDNWLGDVEEPEQDEAEWHLKEIATRAFWALAGLMLLGWFLSSMLSSQLPGSAVRVPGIATAIGSRVVYTYERVTEFIRPPGGPTEADRIAAYKGNGEDDLMWGRMSNIEDKYNKRLEDMRKTIQELTQQLPNNMIVRRHEDGSTEITDDFWRALTSKARSNIDDPEWFRYLEDNKAKLRDLFDTSTAQERTHTETWAQVVTREEFVSHIERQYQNITTRVDEKIRASILAQETQLRTMVREEARKAMLDNIRLSALAQANLVANYELHLTRPNYFSHGLGAMVDADYSSATLNEHDSAFRWVAQRLALVARRNPPKAALSKWEEAGDCWCSAPSPQSTKGQAQLAVTLGRPMTPKQVTIEHIPMAMAPSRNIANAPRDMELWVLTDAHINPYYSHRQVACQPNGPPGWKCLGTFKYNIHASNHLQTFDLAGEPAAPVTKAMLRVTSNWGADYTCLYQTRTSTTQAPLVAAS
ncbi:hypothetical protein EJ02DRAFT_421618 [Clathrospora elynae]|uniref:SUN domain-containing protein n=1 Tax=Clathrospora elynae TaxID=706981 RepID=A0A6A5SWR9_9PLEO|nr:hypothetical protein EJ02DRAFT_421618 [Clathrospora elynae]